MSLPKQLLTLTLYPSFSKVFFPFFGGGVLVIFLFLFFFFKSGGVHKLLQNYSFLKRSLIVFNQ